MAPKYSAPAIDKTAFNCPHCGALAPQHWHKLQTIPTERGETPLRPTENPAFLERVAVLTAMQLANRRDEFEAGKIVSVPAGAAIHEHQIYNMDIAYCGHCGEPSVWIGKNQVYPVSGEILAHDDMPEPARATFSEASAVLAVSPRAAAALARLALQQLCVKLGYEQKSIDQQIRAMVAKGLTPEIQKMLDAVRVFGNNAVHPGEIDMSDDRATVYVVLECMNHICQRLIAEDRQIRVLYGKLPQGALDAIARRDG